VSIRGVVAAGLWAISGLALLAIGTLVYLRIITPTYSRAIEVVALSPLAMPVAIVAWLLRWWSHLCLLVQSARLPSAQRRSLCWQPSWHFRGLPRCIWVQGRVLTAVLSSSSWPKTSSTVMRDSSPTGDSGRRRCSGCDRGTGISFVTAPCDGKRVAIHGRYRRVGW
jgi:hypothetical protein